MLSFQHMGVGVVEEIFTEMEKLRPPSTLGLVATVGAGKSHILALLAAVLFSRGHRVIYLPDCPLVAEERIFALKLAFALAFSDEQSIMHRLMESTKTSDFVELARERRDELCFLVDGTDRLDDEMKGFVRAASGGHSLIYTAYTLDASLGCGHNSAWVRIPSGFSTAEYKHWIAHFESKIPSPLNEIYSDYIEDSSGAVPGLLRPLMDYASHGTTQAVTLYRNGCTFSSLTDKVTEFLSRWETWTKPEQSRFYQIMNACMTETIPEARPGANTALWDPRYFYFDREGKGHTLCGVARDAVVDALRLIDGALFTKDAWYTAARSSKKFLRAQAIMQICLTRIATGGFSQSESTGRAMRVHVFRHTLSFGWMFEEAWKNSQSMSSFLCIPGLDVCRFLAGIIVRISPRDKMAQLIPMQITTNTLCADLATPFFAVVWHKWEAAIREEGFNVVHTYACVDGLTEDSEELMRISIDQREKVKFISPPYTMRNLSVAQLDPKLGRILRPERNLTPDLVKRLP
ncbi:Glycoside hydrolase [Mycena chlorophos]|uniref:Glycoside hydrolase n=1 Tax=Mycena chlorophos TaxID=658473 RepID=A0A8H6TVF0_MYCCL|nr:Glycoside hydrolase [Mycena chlorophos]